MKLGISLGLGYLALLLALSFKAPAARSQKTLLNVSYDPTRELYKRVAERVPVKSSHGGSAAQARAVIDGLKADVVTLALAYDIDAIAARGLIAKDWQSRFPNNSCPYTSTIVFVVRRGNPRNIRDWSDLVRDGVSVVTPNPRTSGGARWAFLAAWGQVTQSGGTERDALEYVGRLYRHVPVLDTGARGAISTFVRKQIGDVLITWENEALLALRDRTLELIYPKHSILTEPAVAVVDGNVDGRGTRGLAEEFVRFLYSEEGQRIISESGYRPVGTRPPVEKLFTIRDIAGSWEAAHRKFFADGGVFDQIFGSN